MRRRPVLGISRFGSVLIGAFLIAVLGATLGIEKLTLEQVAVNFA
jgi:hypothetical protein